MKNAKALKIAALAAVVVFGLGVLIYGLVTGFGFGDFFKTIDDGVYEVPYVYEETTDTLHSIDLSWQSGPVSVALYDGDTVRVTETAKKELKTDEKLTLEMSGGTLTVNWNSAVVNFALRSRSKKLEVEIPKKFAGDLREMTIRTASGMVELASLSVEKGRIETASGDIVLKDITADALDVDTASGKIIAERLAAGEELRLSSVSGSIALTDAEAPSLTLDSTSGSITSAAQADKIEVSTVSGEVKLTLGKWADACNISTVSGGVTCTAPQPEAGFSCTFKTVSGEFKSDFPVQKNKDAYINGGGAHVLKIATTSGNAKILAAS